MGPRTVEEEVVAGVWREVLGLERVGVFDDFFELGGDSISAMRVVAGAREAGLALTPRQVFEHGTVAGLAAVAAPAAPGRSSRHAGRVPLAPMQRWFLDQDVPDPDRWAHVLVLEAREPLDAGLLGRAARALLAHHDALRLRFSRGRRGWTQRIVAEAPPVEIERFGARVGREEMAGALRARLDIRGGRTLGLGVAGGDPGLLLLAVHHLVADAVSLRILVDDLDTAYRQLARGAPVELPAEDTSFADWARGRPGRVRPSTGRAGTRATEVVTIGRRATAGLRRLGPRIEDAALEALAAALGPDPPRIDVEGHGRGDGADLTRTVGLFTELRPAGAGAGPEPGAVRFNYLGRLDAGGSRSRLLRLAGPPLLAPVRVGSYSMEVDAYVLDGRLGVVWTYAPARVGRPAVRRRARAFAAGLRGLAAEHAEAPFPLTPLQAGIVFHALRAPADAGYFTQLSCELDGPLDEAAFEAAWRRVVDATPALRTALSWDEGEPRQAVRAGVRLPWTGEDWRAGDQRGRLEAFLAEDRRRGFDLTRAPLLRVALLRTGGSTRRLVWSFHHLVLDGWSLPLVLEDVLACYHALRRGRRPPPIVRPGVRDRVEALTALETGPAEAYWRGRLAGLSVTKLAGGHGAPDHRHPGHLERRLGTDATGELMAWARRRRLTLGTVVHGAWALLLAHRGGCPDVTFGSTISGRAADDGRVVGMLIATIPVRVRVDVEAALPAWLRRLQREHAEAREHGHLPLVRLRALAGLPARRELFDTLVVVENYPLGALRSPELEIRDVRCDARTHYPLTLRVVPGDDLSLQLAFDAGRAPAADALAAELVMLLRAFVEREDAGPGRFLGLLDAAARERLRAAAASRLRAAAGVGGGTS